MNGELIPWEKAQIHVSAHALHYGSGVFEGLRCYQTAGGPALFRVDAHLERLSYSAGIHGMAIPNTAEQLTKAISELVSRNGFTSCYIRPLCFRGSGNLRLDPESCPVEVCILAWPSNPTHGAGAAKTGVRVCISTWKKFHSDMIPTTAKASGQYINSILAIRQAKAQRYEDALLLNTEGYLAEATAENIFIIRDGKLWTNDERDSILLGVTRLSVIELARDLGYEVFISRLTVDDLIESEEAFLTGTAAEIAPISEVNDKPIGNGECGPITAQIRECFIQIVSGRHSNYSHWLHPLNVLKE
jgi:branched-chain amino acid aminotransferase